MAAGCSLTLSILCLLFSKFLKGRSQWLYLGVMALLQASYCIEIIFYLNAESIDLASNVICVMSASLCFMTYFMGQLTQILLELQDSWFQKFQKFNLALTSLFSIALLIDLSLGTNWVFETVNFHDDTLHKKQVVFTILGMLYLSFVNTTCTIFAFLLLRSYLVKGETRFRWIVLGAVSYFACVISDFSLVFGLYDFYFLQHFGFLVVVVALVYYFATDYYDTTEKYQEAKTVLKKQQEALILSKNFELLAKTSSIIGHEIKSPLSVIAGNSSVLALKLKRNLVDSAYLEKMNQQNKRASYAIQSIVDGIYSLSDDKIDHKQKIIIDEIFTSVQLFTREKILAPNIDIKFIDQTSSQILCNPSQITQVLVNIVNNACDAIEHMEDKWIAVHATELENQIQIEVVDSGAGISKSVKERVFNSFFTTKEKGDGSGLGLGLGIAADIVRLHEGTISATEKGANTCFRILLPKQ